MIGFIVRRCVYLVPTLLGITMAVFLMVHLVPGDPAQVMLGVRATPESLELLRREMGLDQPWYIQFARYVQGLGAGDLGRSIKSHTPIAEELWARFPATLELTLASLGLACILGIGAGILSATRRNSVWDLAGLAASLAGVSMPIFWLGLLLILGLAVDVGLFPVSSRISADLYVTSVTGLFVIDSLLAGDLVALGDVLHHLFLPALTLGTVPAAVISRMTRSSLLEVMQEDYVRTARAKGLAERVVVLRHAMKNAFIPVLTVISLEFGYLLGGAVITETIFAWPGLGRWLLLAVYARDLRAIQGGVLLISVTFVLINLVADVLYAWFDPRIKYSGDRA